MRLHELLHRHLDGVHTVVDMSHEGVELQRYLNLSEEVAYDYQPVENLEKLNLGSGVVVVTLLGPNQPVHADVTELARVLQRFEPGARALLALAWPTRELPYHRLLSPFVDAGCQVLDVAPLDPTSLQGIPSALVIERVRSLQPLRGYLVSDGSQIPTEQQFDELRTMLRIVDEFALSDFAARHVRNRLLDLEHAESARAELARQVAEMAQRAEKLSKQVTSREQQLYDCERQLEALESSISFQAGNALVRAACHPGRGILEFPRTMYGLWRRRYQSQFERPST